MRVLTVTGDRQFGPGHPRYDLQCRAVEKLEVVYWGWKNLWPAIPAGHFDVVTVQDPFWRGLFGWWVARRRGARLNIQVHTDLSARGLFYRLLARFVLRRADSVRLVSEKIKNYLTPLHLRAPVYVLPIYIDVARFRNVARKPHNRKVILWIGRFEREKNPLQAIKVLRQVPGAKLIMLGRGNLEKMLHEAAKGLPVEFPGWQDPANYFAIADVVLSTSYHESYGASMVEALAAHVPVVSPDVGVAKEAGAIVVPREKLAEVVGEVLQKDVHGELKLKLLSREEWAQKWKESLL